MTRTFTESVVEDAVLLPKLLSAVPAGRQGEIRVKDAVPTGRQAGRFVERAAGQLDKSDKSDRWEITPKGRRGRCRVKAG
jgi:hypothetical protein